jgi:hypothetical protein
MTIQNRHCVYVILAALALFGILGVRLWFDARSALHRDVPENIGMGDDLMARVDSLEQEISRRVSYVIDLSRDPLRLATVMRVKAAGDGGETHERKDRMRLSATIVSPNKNRAIIKFRGVSHMVSEGDSLFHGIIQRIDEKTVSFVKDGEAEILINQPAPPEESRRPSRKEIGEIDL